MSQADGQQSESVSPSLSGDAENAIEAKRETLERVANSGYPIAEHAETLLEIANSSN